jgi:hypothetical protein
MNLQFLLNVNVKALKWIGTIGFMICQILTSLNIGYPINIIMGIVGGVCWTWVGVITKDTPLIIVDLFPVVIYAAGVIHWSLT